MQIEEDGPHVQSLGERVQRRFWVKRDKKKILEFVVQLEVLENQSLFLLLLLHRR